jgi:hypothetical protein
MVFHSCKVSRCFYAAGITLLLLTGAANVE